MARFLSATTVSGSHTVRLVDGARDILVGGLEHFLFFHILGMIIPTDELIFFRGVGIPSTSLGFMFSMNHLMIGLLDPFWGEICVITFFSHEPS